MRRDSRLTKKREKSLSDKIIMYSTVGIIVLTVILIVLFLYSKKLSEEVKDSTLTLDQVAGITENSITENNSENTESASTDIGKTVEESKNEIDINEEAENKMNSSNDSNNTTNVSSSQTKNNITATNKTNTIKNENTKNTTANNVNSSLNTTKKEEVKKELSFEKPVEGEIVKEYARDNLVYSETLKEWVTHLGIDIKADKTTVVKAAEAGTIKSIKNDPRYGLTIVIEHGDGFETVYSNLLTSEFVVEGENVEKGQSIGTVGNTAVFEIADEPHLHFEILKDSIQEDPNIYIK